MSNSAPTIILPGQDQFWNEPVTRAEVQKALNEYGERINTLTALNVRLSAILSFVAEKAGITQADLTELGDRIKQAEAVAAAAQTRTPEATPTSGLILL